jgi:hypothetical protein
MRSSVSFLDAGLRFRFKHYRFLHARPGRDRRHCERIYKHNIHLCSGSCAVLLIGLACLIDRHKQIFRRQPLNRFGLKGKIVFYVNDSPPPSQLRSCPFSIIVCSRIIMGKESTVSITHDSKARLDQLRSRLRAASIGRKNNVERRSVIIAFFIELVDLDKSQFQPPHLFFPQRHSLWRIVRVQFHVGKARDLGADGKYNPRI